MFDEINLHNNKECQMCEHLHKDNIFNTYTCKHMCEMKQEWLNKIQNRINKRPMFEEGKDLYSKLESRKDNQDSGEYIDQVRKDIDDYYKEVC